MKKVLLLLGLWLTLLPVIFILRTHETLVMSNYPVLSPTIWDWSVDDYNKENSIENKQKISNEFLQILKDEENTLDDYIANKSISSNNKDKAFLKHMNNVHAVSKNLSQVAIWITEDLATPEKSITLVKTFFNIKYRFKSTLLQGENEQYYTFTEPENPITLVDYPMISIACISSGEQCGANIDKNYYIDKYKGTISDKALQTYNNTEDLSSTNFNETNTLTHIINILNIVIFVLTIFIIKMLSNLYGLGTKIKKLGIQWLNSIVERFRTMKLWYKIILTISAIAFISAYILSSKNVNYQSFVLVATVPFCFLLLTKGIIFRLIVACLFAKAIELFAHYNNICNAFNDPEFIVFLIFSTIAYVTYIVVHIIMKKMIKYIKSKIDFERIKSYFTKQTIITIAAIIALIGIISTHKSVQVPKCDSKFAEETVIRIFKQNDHIYEHNIDNVSYIKMSEFTPIDYDKDINKYTCNAKLTMYANPDSPILFLGAYKSFKYNVRYEIYKERGKNTAKASWEMLNIGAQEFAN